MPCYKQTDAAAKERCCVCWFCQPNKVNIHNWAVCICLWICAYISVWKCNYMGDLDIIFLHLTTQLAWISCILTILLVCQGPASTLSITLTLLIRWPSHITATLCSPLTSNIALFTCWSGQQGPLIQQMADVMVNRRAIMILHKYSKWINAASLTQTKLQYFICWI